MSHFGGELLLFAMRAIFVICVLVTFCLAALGVRAIEQQFRLSQGIVVVLMLAAFVTIGAAADTRLAGLGFLSH